MQSGLISPLAGTRELDWTRACSTLHCHPRLNPHDQLRAPLAVGGIARLEGFAVEHDPSRNLCAAHGQHRTGVCRRRGHGVPHAHRLRTHQLVDAAARPLARAAGDDYVHGIPSARALNVEAKALDAQGGRPVGPPDAGRQRASLPPATSAHSRGGGQDASAAPLQAARDVLQRRSAAAPRIQRSSSRLPYGGGLDQSAAVNLVLRCDGPGLQGGDAIGRARTCTSGNASRNSGSAALDSGAVRGGPAVDLIPVANGPGLLRTVGSSERFA